MRTLRGVPILAALLPFAVLALEPDPIVGEWAVDRASCREARLVFTFEGTKESLVAEDGRWKSLGAAEYWREGDVLIIRHGDTEERIEILEQQRDRLVLRNRESAGGDVTTELVRCPTF